MKVSNCLRVAAGAILALTGACAWASVAVTIVDANHAVADISLTDASSITYTATVRISFDQAYNLTTNSLNLTAELVNPDAPPAVLPIGVTVDRNFPVLISIEPPAHPSDTIYTSGFEFAQPTDGSLAFVNTYEIEVEAYSLTCPSMTSDYRLYKAPHGSNVFADVTDDLFTGSVRARGRGGAFSQFLVVHDTQNFVLSLLSLPIVLVEKVGALTLAITSAVISAPGLVGTLLVDLNVDVVGNLLLLNVNGAVAGLQKLIQDVVDNAGTSINNVWTAGSPVVNDAGQILSAADTLMFTLKLLQGNPTCQLPPTP